MDQPNADWFSALLGNGYDSHAPEGQNNGMEVDDENDDFYGGESEAQAGV